MASFLLPMHVLISIFSSLLLSSILPLLVLISILAITGSIYNIRTKNNAGIVIGGLFTLGVVGVTIHALFVEFQIYELIRGFLM